LWFVDILGPRLYWFDPESGEHGVRAVSEPIGWVLSVRDSDRLLVGLKSGLALIDPFDASAKPEWIDRRFPTDSGHRLNDAKADDVGRLWYGSMSATDESHPVGSFARYDIGRGAPIIVDDGYLVTNGPAFNEDCTVMLHSDSGQRTTYRYSLDVTSGTVGKRSVWKQFRREDGYPDGMTFDAGGCVWIAHWGAAKLCRYDVDGRRLLTVPMPTSHVSNVCFGGKDLSRLFVTTASIGLSNEQRAEQPHAGALFEVMGHGVKGGPSRQVRI
jgi:sugar lactone lactonase YvrE